MRITEMKSEKTVLYDKLRALPREKGSPKSASNKINPFYSKAEPPRIAKSFDYKIGQYEGYNHPYKPSITKFINPKDILGSMQFGIRVDKIKTIANTGFDNTIPIDVVKIKNGYYLMDGNHRAVVALWLNKPVMARIWTSKDLK